MIREKTFVAEILGLLGMSQSEAVDYLRARGVQASLGAVKGWCRGVYFPTAVAVEELLELWIDVRDGSLNKLPEETPPGVVRRAEAIATLQEIVEELEWNRGAKS